MGRSNGDTTVNEKFATSARDNPVVRNYANEAFIDDEVDQDNQVLDLMTPNIDQVFVREAVDTEDQRKGYFKEFENTEGMVSVNIGGREVEVPSGYIAYEAFMHEPVVIRIHESKDENEPPLVFVGVNGDCRWL